jgi:SAM-dependent methyltransferase
MVAEARENLAAFPNVRVAVTDGFVLSEFPDHAFDVVFGQGVLGYLDPNPLLALLDEVHRVLQPGGVCVFNFLTIDNESDAETYLATVGRQAHSHRFHGGTDRAYAAAQIRAMYEAVGLDSTEPRPASTNAEPPSGRVVIVGRA